MDKQKVAIAIVAAASLTVGATLSGCVVNPDGSSGFVPLNQKARVAYMRSWEDYGHER